jgi:hypothetical protein
MIIYEDTRQQNRYSELDIFKPYDVQRICLKTADYTTDAPRALLIEVKGIWNMDIIHCFGKEKARFMREVERGFDVLILEGSKSDIPAALKKRKSRMTPQYIFACLESLHARHGISIIFAGSKENAAKILHDLLVMDYELKMIEV